MSFEVSAKKDTWVKSKVPLLSWAKFYQNCCNQCFQGGQLYGPDLNPPSGWGSVPSDLEAKMGQHFSAKAQFPNAVLQSDMCLAGPTNLSGRSSTSPGLWREKQTDFHIAFWSKCDPKGILEFLNAFLIGLPNGIYGVCLNPLRRWLQHLNNRSHCRQPSRATPLVVC